ncbi:SUMO-like Rad60 family protein [Metarhizium robertsii]|uniref:SUMO-like Rad60 family protein n=1 Tax=Metarhizium robertsii TaxID=568076 RepID=A0A014MUH9_9HYPO|nr:SUMO-like Rad60 family protein [Metarhizium robertsii]
MNDGASTPPHPTAKKLPFKATALRKAALLNVGTIADKKGSENDGLDLFRRSKEMEPLIAADHERRLKKQRQEYTRRRSAESSAKRVLDAHTEKDVVAEAKSGKPPQEPQNSTPVTSELAAEGELLARLLAMPPVSIRARLDSTPSANPRLHIDDTDHMPDLSSSTRVTRFHPNRARCGSPCDDALTPSRLSRAFLNSNDEANIQIAPAPTTQRDNLEPESSFIAGDENDEFAKYIHKAEEQRAQEQALLGPDQAAAPETIDILVTSIVPDTKPCCFKFLFKKQLRLARNTWLALQKAKGALLDIEKEDDIVLTWRRKRHQWSRKRSDKSLHGSVDVGLVPRMEREEQLKRKRETGELPDRGDSAPVGEELPAPEVKIRVILKAHNRADVKLTVRPGTTVKTLITGFRTQQSIGSDTNVEVWFDGGKLDEHVTMNEADIDDMDMFEVHVK